MLKRGDKLDMLFDSLDVQKIANPDLKYCLLREKLENGEILLDPYNPVDVIIAERYDLQNSMRMLTDIDTERKARQIPQLIRRQDRVELLNVFWQIYRYGSPELKQAIFSQHYWEDILELAILTQRFYLLPPKEYMTMEYAWTHKRSYFYLYWWQKLNGIVQKDYITNVLYAQYKNDPNSISIWEKLILVDFVKSVQDKTQLIKDIQYGLVQDASDDVLTFFAYLVLGDVYESIGDLHSASKFYSLATRTNLPSSLAVQYVADYKFAIALARENKFALLTLAPYLYIRLKNFWQHISYTDWKVLDYLVQMLVQFLPLDQLEQIIEDIEKCFIIGYQPSNTTKFLVRLRYKVHVLPPPEWARHGGNWIDSEMTSHKIWSKDLQLDESQMDEEERWFYIKLQELRSLSVKQQQDKIAEMLNLIREEEPMFRYLTMLLLAGDLSQYQSGELYALTHNFYLYAFLFEQKLLDYHTTPLYVSSITKDFLYKGQKYQGIEALMFFHGLQEHTLQHPGEHVIKILSGFVPLMMAEVSIAKELVLNHMGVIEYTAEQGDWVLNIFAKEIPWNVMPSDISLVNTYAMQLVRYLEGQARQIIHDGLTHLLNKHFFRSRVEEELKILQRENNPNVKHALIIIDLDNFKGVNDNFGHETGDFVLKEIAKAIKDSVRQYDLVARIGGDEFAVFVKDVKDTQTVETIINRIEKNVDNVIKNKLFSITPIDGFGASAGYVIITAGKTYDELFKEADQNMYTRKQQRKQAFNYNRHGR